MYPHIFVLFNDSVKCFGRRYGKAMSSMRKDHIFLVRRSEAGEFPCKLHWLWWQDFRQFVFELEPGILKFYGWSYFLFQLEKLVFWRYTCTQHIIQRGMKQNNLKWNDTGHKAKVNSGIRILLVGELFLPSRRLRANETIFEFYPLSFANPCRTPPEWPARSARKPTCARGLREISV